MFDKVKDALLLCFTWIWFSFPLIVSFIVVWYSDCDWIEKFFMFGLMTFFSTLAWGVVSTFLLLLLSFTAWIAMSLLKPIVKALQAIFRR